LAAVALTAFAVRQRTSAAVPQMLACSRPDDGQVILGGLCGLIYAAAGQTRIKVWAAMVAAVLVSSPQKV
jgi:hypothetical protein